MAHFGAFERVPWKKYLSEEAASTKDPCFFSGAPHKIEAVLRTRALGFAMVRACSFVAWEIYIKYFMKHYTSPPPTPTHKQPGLIEAEEADRRAF